MGRRTRRHRHRRRQQGEATTEREQELEQFIRNEMSNGLETIQQAVNSLAEKMAELFDVELEQKQGQPPQDTANPPNDDRERYRREMHEQTMAIMKQGQVEAAGMRAKIAEALDSVVSDMRAR